MADITYRTLEKADCRDALRFWADSPGVSLHKNGEDTVSALTAFLERNPGLSFLALDNGEIIGAILCGHDGRRGYIYHLAVAGPFRRTGIGKKLLRLCAEQLRANNIKKAALFILNENDIAESFYKSLLWREEDGVKVLSKII